MRGLVCVISITFLCCFGSVNPARGQVEAQLNCEKDKGPLGSYCEDLKQFFADGVKAAEAATDGKIDRHDLQLKSELRTIVAVDSIPDRFVSLIAPDVALRDALRGLEKAPDASSAISQATLASENQNRPDQQLSAGSNASGTTSLVAKPGSSAILAFALESGALTRSVSGNTATLSGNGDGLYRALTGQEAVCFGCPETPVNRVLRDVNLSAAFTINQNSDSTVSTSGAANAATPSTVTDVMLPSSTGKLSNLTARYQVFNPYDPRSGKFLDAWQRAVLKSEKDIDERTKDLQSKLVTLLNKNAVQRDDEFQSILKIYEEKFYEDVETKDGEKFKRDFVALFDASVKARMKADPQFSQHIASAATSVAEYKNLWNKLLNEAKGQPLFTFEYAFNRQQNQPETHDFRLVYGYTPKNAIGLLSVNAAMSFYGNTIPAGAKYGRLRDGQISAEYDRPIAMRNNENQATFSLAAYWQYQLDPSVLNITPGNLVPGTSIPLPQDAQVLLGTAGSLWVTQAKFVINAKSGNKIPIAVKWSNRTELLTGNKLGAQVGISYDFSSLNSLFGGRN